MSENGDNHLHWNSISLMDEHTIDLGQEMDTELIQEFLSDGFEHLAGIENGILDLEADPHNSEAIDSVFRAFHTFKGNAGFLNFTPIAELAHRLENLLDAVRSGSFSADTLVVELILEGGDLLQQFVGAISDQVSGRQPVSPISIDTSHLLQKLDAKLSPDSGDAAVAAPSPVVTDNPMEELSGCHEAASSDLNDVTDAALGDLFSDQTVVQVQPADEKGGQDADTAPAPVSEESAPEPEVQILDPAMISVSPSVQSDTDESVGAPRDSKPASVSSEGANRDETGKSPASTEALNRKPAMESSSSVKVATHKLDSLVDLVGEFVIAQSQVMQSIHGEAFLNEHAVRNLAQLSRISKELQRTAMSLRMVPIRNTFQRMQRLVRDVSSRQGKQVNLVLEGEETEIDRNIVEAIHDPLVHMIRNSVDHGIERSEVREAAGKDPVGRIILKAYHQAGNIIIEIIDDGAGLDRDRILEKAISRKLIDPSVELSDDEVFNLIFTPGFSTAETITDISGRGVGMDVVKRNIHKLRGRIGISSEKGSGSRFEISLPLTLAIIEGLLVRVNSHCYILPVNSVKESFRMRKEQTNTVNGRGRLIRVREQMIPLLDLGEYFHVGTNRTRDDDRIVIILESENGTRGIVVDELVGKHEVVIKNIGSVFEVDPAISGATILGNGLVGLILEPSVLVRLPVAA
jgi:two-component system chemotaxis sensor kinase CheA